MTLTETKNLKVGDTVYYHYTNREVIVNDNNRPAKITSIVYDNDGGYEHKQTCYITAEFIDGIPSYTHFKENIKRNRPLNERKSSFRWWHLQPL